MNTPVNHLELMLLRIMTTIENEDPNGVHRISRVYHSFMGTLRTQPTQDIIVEPEDMIPYLEDEADLRWPETDEFGGKDYTIPESQMRRLRLA